MNCLAAGVLLQSGKYVLQQTLGQGGFGITYLGRDTILERDVAIKEMFPYGSVRVGREVRPPKRTDLGTMSAEFLKEGRILSR